MVRGLILRKVCAVILTILALGGSGVFGAEVIPPPRLADGWNRTLDDAVLRAGRTGSPLFLFFTARHSPPCQAMEREVFSNKDVRKVMRQVEAVRIDVDAEPGLAGH